MRTKAQSQIITTILLILIVLAAVVVVWVVVNQFLKPVESNPAACMVVQLNAVRASSIDQDVVVTRLAGGADDDVTGVTFLVEGSVVKPNAVDGVACTTGDCNADGVATLTQLETKTFTFLTGTIDSGEEVKVGAVIGEKGAMCNPVASVRAN